MVWFQCEGCGDTLKKPKLPGHARGCPGGAPAFTCIDCLVTFDRAGAQRHNSCVTEHQKYAEGATKPGGIASRGGGGGGAGAPASGGGGGADGEAVGLEYVTEKAPYRCKLCNVTCTGWDNVLSHAASKKHRNRYKGATAAAAAAAGATGGASGGAGNGGGAAAGTTSSAPTGRQNSSAPGAAAKKPVDRPASVDWCKLTSRILKKSGPLKKKKLLKKVMKKAGLSESDCAKEWERCVTSAGRVSIEGKLVSLVNNS